MVSRLRSVSPVVCVREVGAIHAPGFKVGAALNSFYTVSLDWRADAGTKSSAEETAMARTTDSARFEGYAVAVNGRWGGFLRLTYPSPLDIGAMVKIEDWVLFISSISPITATGATECYPQIAKGETAGGRDA